ncbi:hypothetical protein ACNFBR_22935 [Pseudomonas sp. NY11955]|uniref:8-oxoguanine DNA glycosylase OGG fold protein n=1 Tax=Pseudomonas sp. NY11955 TaxID=3400363 RepID=UPI003A88ACE2
MIPVLNPAKVALFQRLNITPPTPWTGASPHDWAESVQPGLGRLYSLSKAPMSRSALRALWADPSVSVESCFLSTMAWGGMQRGNGRRIWAARANCLAVCADVRAGKHTPASGFQAFSTLRDTKSLPGMGPAYFTKILFFAAPSQNAYILDQWTARSMHLLSGQGAYPAVRKDYTSAAKAQKLKAPQALRVIVDDKVTAVDYVDYCNNVNGLAATLGWPAHQVEERLFSSGGRAPHPWRNEVMLGWAGPTWNFYA